nr:hypothetical protein [Rhodococcus qingshengii]
MGLFNRGQAASALILDGKRAVRAYLGDQLVWDGTMDAFVPIPQILVSVVMADPVVSATVRTVAPLITASAQVYEPSVSGTATVRPETAILVAGVVYAPDVSAEALIEVPAISVSAIVLAPTVSEAFDATVEVPFIQVTAGMYSPKITADYAATVPIIAAFAELLAPLVTATGTAVINAPMIAVTGSVNAPAVIGSSAVTAPLIAVSATVYAPEIRRDAKVIAPSITGTATAYVPNVQAINFSPSGMTKNGNWVPTANGAWLVVPAWTADSGSTVSGDGVQARGAKANAVVSGQLSITLSTGAYQVSVRLKVDGVVVKTITDYPLTGYATTNVPIASDPMAITTGQVATIECWFTNFSNSFPIQSGANTYVRIT